MFFLEEKVSNQSILRWRSRLALFTYTKHTTVIHLSAKSLPLHPDLDFQLVLEECNQMIGRKRQYSELHSSSSFIPPYTTSRETVFPLVWQWAHIVTNRTGFQDKELFMQHANYEAFKCPYNRHGQAVKEGVLIRLLFYYNISILVKWQVQKPANPGPILNHQPGKWCLVINETFQPR